jgi:hypothetical protein
MKKLVAVAVLAIGLILIMNESVKADDPKGNDLLVGRWELCTPDGKPSENPKVRQKVYVRDSYVVLEVNKNDNTVFIDFVGKITYQGEGRLTETPIYTHPGIKHMLSKDFRFSYRIEGRYLYLEGLNNSFNEIWIRVGDEGNVDDANDTDFPARRSVDNTPYTSLRAACGEAIQAGVQSAGLNMNNPQ